MILKFDPQFRKQYKKADVRIKNQVRDRLRIFKKNPEENKRGLKKQHGILIKPSLEKFLTIPDRRRGILRLAGSLSLAPTESDVKQEESDQQKSENNNGGSIHLSNIHTVILSSISNAVSKQSVARIPSAVNMTMLKGENPETVGTMIAAPIHPAERLVNNPDNTLALDRRTDIFINDEYSITYNR